MSLRVLVVDDSILFRQVISEVLSEMDNVTVVGTAMDGQQALEKIEELSPDMVTLDVEMPIMDGLKALPLIKRNHPEIEVVMISSLTKRGAQLTIQALSGGAFDYIEKSDQSSPQKNATHIQQQLQRIIKVLFAKQNRKGFSQPPTQERLTPKVKQGLTVSVMPRVHRKQEKMGVVAIGVSTGGPNALPILLKNFPTGLNIPILIVQQMPPLFLSALIESLDKTCPLSVREAKHFEKIRPNTVYLSPGEKHMKITKKPGVPEPMIVLTDEPPLNYCKPSVDYLFESVAEHYGGAALGIIMTGMGYDGVAGLKSMKKAGATVFAQDEASSVVYGMAKEAVKAGVVDEVIPLNMLSNAIEKQILQR